MYLNQLSKKRLLVFIYIILFIFVIFNTKIMADENLHQFDGTSDLKKWNNLEEKVEANDEPATLSLYLENDIFTSGEDGGYSNGLKLTWSSGILADYPKDVWPHRWLYPIIKLVPFEKFADRRKNVTFSLGQNIYTPADIDKDPPDEDDRPYAGITYFSLGFHSRLERQMDTIELTLGLVGPDSYAEQCQKTVHKIFDDIEPKGWDHQLNNEPVIGIVYEHKKRMIQSGLDAGFGYDCVLNTGGGLGNAMTYYNLGLTFRFGWNLPNDFGNFPIRTVSSFNAASDKNARRYASNKIGIQLFAGVEGRAVLYNIFLDGNTFTDSPSVDKKPIVADYMTGISISHGPVQLSFAYVIRSKEFETQEKTQSFGSINLSFSY